MANATARGAIHDRWNADSGLTALALKLFNEEPPEASTLGSFFYIEDFEEVARLLSSSGLKDFLVGWVFVGQIVGTASAETLVAAGFVWFSATTPPPGPHIPRPRAQP